MTVQSAQTAGSRQEEVVTTILRLKTNRLSVVTVSVTVGFRYHRSFVWTLLSSFGAVATPAADAEASSTGSVDLGSLAGIRGGLIDVAREEASHAIKRALQFDDINPNNDTVRAQEKFVPGYFATPSPTSAPKPNRKPSAKRVDAFLKTHAASTLLKNSSPAALSPLKTMLSV